MSRYSVEFVPSVDKVIQRLPVRDQKRIVLAAESLADDPRPVRSIMLAGTENVWRIRVGDFRILYGVHDARHVVLVVRGQSQGRLPGLITVRGETEKTFHSYSLDNVRLHWLSRRRRVAARYLWRYQQGAEMGCRRTQANKKPREIVQGIAAKCGGMDGT